MEARLAEVLAENVRLREENAALRADVAGLEDRIAELEAERDQHSGTSSKPPSSDTTAQRAEQIARREQNAKSKGKRRARKPGKQPGAEGHSLSRVEPDETVVHSPPACGLCGDALNGAPIVARKVRQVLDLPPRRLVATDHVAEERRCPGCGTTTAAAFPAEATAPVCFGPGMRAAGLYLTGRQHLPVERAAEAMAQLLGAPVSTGFLSGLWAEAGDRLEPFIDRLKAVLRQAPVLHADETGARVSGKKRWFHTLSTATLTLVACHQLRGAQALLDIGVLPGHDGVVVHDGWKPYQKIDGPAHAQCGAHILRHLEGVAVVWSQQPWAEEMADLLRSAKKTAARAALAGHDRVHPAAAGRIRARYDRIITNALSKLPNGPPPRKKNTGGWLWFHRKAWNLLIRLRDDKDDILRFLTDTAVPFDNNQAERDLRMVKLQQKISGTFRSEAGARHFAHVRSYLQTAAKQGINLLDALTRLFTTGPWLPPAATTP